MGLLDSIKQKYNNIVLARAQKFEAEKQRVEQERQLQIEKEQQSIQKLLNSEIPKDFIIRLGRDIYGNNKYKYTIYEYFVCNVKPKDMQYGQWTKARKVSGKYFGKVFNMCVHSSPFSPSLTKTELYIGDDRWEGDKDDSLYIPADCVTIADLRDYAKRYNEEIVNRYDEDLKRKRIEEEEIRNKFF